jgi:hypothetical protein
MKQIFTLITSIIMSFGLAAQVVLNELYTDPGAGKHEFFELYNNSSSSLPMSLAGYSVITYFEGVGNEKGFYVLDLPDLDLASKGYFVGSAANPFNYQGTSGSTKSQFSWNDLAFLNNNNSYLKKWVVGTAVGAAIDGNANYDEKPVPSNFNEFFSRRTGGGAAYSVFVYKNGNLVNAFFGGSSKQEVPAFITSMPRLKLKLAGISNEFNINFNNIPRFTAEYVIADAGSDNGFIRHRDGLCGAWGKSSAGVQHSPGETNGSIFGALGSISISSTISRGTNASEFSTLSYKVVSASPEALPLILDIYSDNGTKLGELDAKDAYLSSDTIYTVSDTVYTIKYKPYDANILIAVKAAPGCYEKVFLPLLQSALLPANILDFNGFVENNSLKLQWKVSDNEKGNVFEVEKSEDGSNFKMAGLVFASEKAGMEEYFFKGIAQKEPTAFYRLKIISMDRSIAHSRVIQVKNNAAVPGSALHLQNNPVDSYLGFNYLSETSNTSEVSIYSMTGTKLYSERLATKNGGNTFTLNMGGKINAGIYLLEIRNGGKRTTTRFIKK